MKETQKEKSFNVFDISQNMVLWDFGRAFLYVLWFVAA